MKITLYRRLLATGEGGKEVSFCKLENHLSFSAFTLKLKPYWLVKHLTAPHSPFWWMTTSAGTYNIKISQDSDAMYALLGPRAIGKVQKNILTPCSRRCFLYFNSNLIQSDLLRCYVCIFWILSVLACPGSSQCPPALPVTTPLWAKLPPDSWSQTQQSNIKPQYNTILNKARNTKYEMQKCLYTSPHRLCVDLI